MLTVVMPGAGRPGAGKPVGLGQVFFAPGAKHRIQRAEPVFTGFVHQARSHVISTAHINGHRHCRLLAARQQ